MGGGNKIVLMVKNYENRSWVDLLRVVSNYEIWFIGLGAETSGFASRCSFSSVELSPDQVCPPLLSYELATVWHAVY
jgi:hypothetical protein